VIFAVVALVIVIAFETLIGLIWYVVRDD